MENRPCWTGLISGLSATVAWGLFPIYWKQFGPVGSLEAFCHKVLWSGVVAALFLTVQGRWGEVQAVVTQPRRLRWFLLSGVLIALNGFLFIYTVSSGHVMESSLGYYLTPLACFVLGKLFLRERLRPLQRLAVGLAAGGVAWLTVKYGHFPWLATGLCLSFGCYGLVRKMAPAGSLVGFFLETLWLSPLAAALIMGLLAGHHGSFIYAGPRISGLLCGAGVVTALPRLWFAAAARQISLTTLGLLEYTTPTLMFALSAFAYHEAVTSDHVITFGLIWLGIGLYTLEGFRQATNAAQSPPASRETRLRLDARAREETGLRGYCDPTGPRDRAGFQNARRSEGEANRREWAGLPDRSPGGGSTTLAPDVHHLQFTWLHPGAASLHL